MSYCARGPRNPPSKQRRRCYIWEKQKTRRNISGVEDLSSRSVNIGRINNGLDEARPTNSDPNYCANLYCSSSKNNKLSRRTWFFGWPMSPYSCLPPFSFQPVTKRCYWSETRYYIALCLSDRHCAYFVWMKRESMVFYVVIKELVR